MPILGPSFRLFAFSLCAAPMLSACASTGTLAVRAAEAEARCPTYLSGDACWPLRFGAELPERIAADHTDLFRIRVSGAFIPSRLYDVRRAPGGNVTLTVTQPEQPGFAASRFTARLGDTTFGGLITGFGKFQRDFAAAVAAEARGRAQQPLSPPDRETVTISACDGFGATFDIVEQGILRQVRVPACSGTVFETYLTATLNALLAQIPQCRTMSGSALTTDCSRPMTQILL
jgi:hypothetical protein